MYVRNRAEGGISISLQSLGAARLTRRSCHNDLLETPVLLGELLDRVVSQGHGNLIKRLEWLSWKRELTEGVSTLFLPCLRFQFML